MEDYKTHVLSCLMIDKDGDVPFMDVIPIVKEHQLFSGKMSSLDGVVKSIHSHLGSSKSRKLGLGLLKEFVGQCSTDLFLSHVNTWINLLLQTLQSHDSDVCHQAVCYVLSDILETSSCFPELSRDISNSTVPQIFPLLLEANMNWREAALSCIGVCIKNFPGPCGTFKNKLESLIWQELSENSTTQSVISCFALLPRCGGGGSQGVKFTESWTEQCSKVLSGLNQALDLLYEGLETGSEYHPADRLPQMSCPDSEPARGKYLTGHFQTLALCLEALLSESFPTVVKVPVESVLHIVCRCLAVNKNVMLSRPSTSRIWLLARLPFLQRQALTVLASLIRSVRHGLLPHSDVINKLFLQTLFSTHWDSATYGQECPLRFVRQSAYSGLLLWLQVAGYGTNLILEGNDLAKELLHDIVPVTDTVRLDVKKRDVNDGPPVKKKKKGGGYQELGGGIGSQKKMNRFATADLTVIALDVLAALVECFGPSWKPKTYKDILQSLIATTISVQQSSEPPVPYQSGTCRLALYTALLSCTVTVHSDVPSPVQITMGLFRRSLQDHCLEVSTFSKRAMLFCECIIHPRAPCVRGPSLIQCNIIVETPQKNSGDITSVQTDHFQESLVLSRHHVGAMDTHGEPQTNGIGSVDHGGDGSGGGDMQDVETSRSRGDSKIINLKDFKGVATQTENRRCSHEEDDQDDDDDDDDDVVDVTSATDECQKSETERQSDVVMDTDNAEVMTARSSNEKESHSESLSEAPHLKTGEEQRQKDGEINSTISITTATQQVTLGVESTSSLCDERTESQQDTSADQSFTSAQSQTPDIHSVPSALTSSDNQPSAEVEAMLLSFVDADPDSE
ncbi:proline-, glutamic acid- and leucine-rich protein 1-like isoform X2 [Gigantopelta aegis]|uniref:proline-, glutamic acid- and leucine-rich protein 1-like isoform X2 n=1 Tax=Gigantopelta aegis TaxID=1735272 RepID=UPI001B88D538|nr:proline-, glutamic acid- and leucine-rich protein 1-like isoform X2 [Gigantopelta aegis]